ncbi:MAG: branched-chain amino acid aminotransferase [Erysipelotrichaceae bacterium]
MKFTASTSLKPKPTNYKEVGFGKVFTDYMLVAHYSVEHGWDEGEIKPFQNLSLHPATTALHYAQEIFEGLKAYKGVDGMMRMFRIEDNWQRFNRSAQALAMPEVPKHLFVEGIKQLVSLEKDWLVYDEQVTLYVRPFLIGVDETLGLKPAEHYQFIVILSVVGDYYPADHMVRIKVEDEHVRACPKGLGMAKTGANYAASLLAGAQAKAQGYDQVLWLDASSGNYIEEVGAMNIFFVIDNKIVTPELNGTILAGIVRDSILTFAPKLGYEVETRRISIHDLVKWVEEGRVSEVFGSGTAAIVSSVGVLHYHELNMEFTENKVAQAIKRYLLDQQFGHQNLEPQWIHLLD